MSADHRRPSPSRLARNHRQAVDRGAKACGMDGGFRVWRTIKAVSQLVAITAGFWFGLNGTIPPTFAFVGILIIYLGAEQAESIIAAIGSEGGLNVSISPGTTDDEDE